MTEPPEIIPLEAAQILLRRPTRLVPLQEADHARDPVLLPDALRQVAFPRILIAAGLFLFPTGSSVDNVPFARACASKVV